MVKQICLAAALGVALLAGCGNGTAQGTLGLGCTEDSQCDKGTTCYKGQPGGYCTKGCSVSGETSECPANTVCAAHSGVLLCSLVCTDKAQCREGYECNGVSGSDKKSCRPK